MGDIKNTILEKVRNFGTNTPWKKILTFSFFVILSASFWFMQVYKEFFYASYDIPIKYVSYPDSVVFQNELPQKISIRVRDNGYNLFRYYFLVKRDSLEINVSEFLGTRYGNALPEIALQQMINEDLPTSSTLDSYNPSSIDFSYSVLMQKKVPVEFDGQVFFAPGYLQNGRIYTEPDSVTLYGPQEVLNRIMYAYTISDTIYNFKSKRPLAYSLNPIENVRFVPDYVEVVVPVDEFTQKEVIVPIECINLPEDLDVRFFPSTVKVSFLVGLSKYQFITEEDFSIQFDYNDLIDVMDLSVPVQLTSSPDSIQNPRLSPSEIEFIFEQK